MSEPTPSPAENESASRRVAAAIRTMILSSADLGPGARIGREEDLTERFGVSRPTLREALIELSSQHLVRSVKGPGGGIFVAAGGETSMQLVISDLVAALLAAGRIDLRELVDTRLLLEVPLAGIAAARATDAGSAELREALGTRTLGSDDVAELPAVDARVHAIIVELADSRLTASLLGWVGSVAHAPLYELIRDAVLVPVVFDQLEDIVRAIEQGESRRAEAAMREHLLYLRDVLSAVDQASKL